MPPTAGSSTGERGPERLRPVLRARRGARRVPAPALVHRPRAAAERLGATLLELPPGRTATPYHWLCANEEMLIVVAGRPSLRAPDGWRELVPGEVVSFRRGEQGAHQVSNFSDDPMRFLLISEMVGFELAVYPDSGKIGARQTAPGPGPRGIWQVHRSAEAVDYREGETPP